jgi:hypothetical protein
MATRTTSTLDEPVEEMTLSSEPVTFPASTFAHARSLTGQTRVDAEVQADGRTLLTVMRYGQCLLRWSVQEETEIPKSAEVSLSEDGREVVVTITNDNGTTVEYDRLPVID